jgi:hypothetical protein
MRQVDEFRYHVERARAELDAGYRAGAAIAAAAHLRFSALHIARARAAAQASAQAPLHELEWIERLRPLHEKALTGG